MKVHQGRVDGHRMPMPRMPGIWTEISWLSIASGLCNRFELARS
jgi:hypothetical protein